MIHAVVPSEPRIEQLPVELYRIKRQINDLNDIGVARSEIVQRKAKTFGVHFMHTIN